MEVFKTKKVVLAVFTVVICITSLSFFQSCSNEFDSNENFDEIEFNQKIIALAKEYKLTIKLPLKVNNYDQETLDSITKYMQTRISNKEQKFTQALQLKKSNNNEFKFTPIKRNIRFKLDSPESGLWRFDETNWMGFITEYIVVYSNNGNYSVSFSAVNNSFKQVGGQEITTQGHYICYEFYGEVTRNVCGLDFVDAVKVTGYCNTLTGTGNLIVEYN